MLLARETAYLQTHQAGDKLRALFSRVMKIAIPGATAVLVIALAFSVPIEHLLDVESLSVVVAGLSALGFLILGAILYGFLQGAQRFGPLAANYTINGLARPVLVVPVLMAGLGATGALAVNALAAAGSVALALWSLRDLWRGPKTTVKAPRLPQREVVILLIGSLAFASLTNIDIVLANYYLSPDDAGVYSAAALVGKFVLFLPVGIVTVLLPKASARAAVGATSERILMLSAGVTLAMTLVATGVLALVPESLLVWAFGAEFRDATALLPYFGLAMTAAALVNVYLFVYLAHKDARFPVLVGFAAIAEIILISAWHPDAQAIVLSILACCAAILVIHEVAGFPHSVFRVLRLRTRTP